MVSEFDSSCFRRKRFFLFLHFIYSISIKLYAKFNLFYNDNKNTQNKNCILNFPVDLELLLLVAIPHVTSFFFWFIRLQKNLSDVTMESLCNNLNIKKS